MHGDWMKLLPEPLKKLPIISLSIPGSHNSFSYTINTSADVSPDSPALVRYLSRAFRKIANPIIYKWSLTQKLNITKQLELGIRYLDIRVVSRNQELFVAHGLYGASLLPLLQEVNNFLDSHNEEVVVLDFQHFYCCERSDHETLMRHLEAIFGSRICRRDREIHSVSLETLQRKGEQVIIVYRCGAFHSNSVWPSKVYPTPWPNTFKIPDLIRFLDRVLANRDTEIGLVTQCILTVSVGYVFSHFNSSLQALASKTNTVILPWIRSQGSRRVNVVIVDFVQGDFVESVLDLNK